MSCRLRLQFVLFLAVVLFFLSACRENRAKALFEEAREQMKQEAYDEALFFLDSIDRAYPEEITLRQEVLETRKRIYALQNRQRLTEITFLLDSLQVLRDSLQRYVSFSPHGEYYYPYGNQPRKLPQKDHMMLRLKCDTLGFTSFEVIYFGAKSLSFVAIAFVVGDSIVQSTPCPLGKVLNCTTTIDMDNYDACTYQMLIIPPKDSKRLLQHLRLLPRGKALKVRLLSRRCSVLYEDTIFAQRVAHLKSLARFSEVLYLRYHLLLEKNRRELRYQSQQPLAGVNSIVV